MPANIRVRCRFLDCEKLNGVYCDSAEVEFNPRAFCVTYTPIGVEEPEDIDEEIDEEDALEDAEDWLDEDDDDTDDLAALNDDD